jgi:homoserine kinase
LSGAGPTILALATTNFENVAEGAKKIFGKKGISVVWHVLEVSGAASVEQL